MVFFEYFSFPLSVSFQQYSIHICSFITSHKSNPSSVLQGYVDSYSTLPWVTVEAVTGVEGVPCGALLRHTLAKGALAYPNQGGRYRAEGCMALG